MTAQVIDMLAALKSRAVAIASSLDAVNVVSRSRPVVNRKTLAEAEAHKDEFFAVCGAVPPDFDVPPYIWPTVEWLCQAMDEYGFWGPWFPCDEDDAIRGRHARTMRFKQNWGAA